MYHHPHGGYYDTDSFISINYLGLVHYPKIIELERVETWEYPIDALREAVTNAICHRDYEECSNVQVRIFDDRVEIWGCGSLPEPLTVDDLKHSHRSILRNPLIGKCLFLIKIAVCAVCPSIIR